MSNGKKSTSNTSQTFSDIVRGMQHAVNTAQETLQAHQFYLMQRYFKEDGTPYLVTVKLQDGRIVTIPQITLIPQSLLAIEEMEMAFAVVVAHSEVKSFKQQIKDFFTPKNTKTPKGSPDDAEELDRSSFTVDFARGSDTANNPDIINVKIKFKSILPPEGASRVLDMLNLDIGEQKES